MQMRFFSGGRAVLGLLLVAAGCTGQSTDTTSSSSSSGDVTTSSSTAVVSSSRAGSSGPRSSSAGSSSSAVQSSSEETPSSSAAQSSSEEGSSSSAETSSSDLGSSSSEIAASSSDTGTSSSDTGTSSSDTGTSSSDTGTSSSDMASSSSAAQSSSMGPPPDTTPPAMPMLSLSGLTGTSVNISWTAVGDDGDMGTVTSHELFVGTAPNCPLTAANLDTATSIPGLDPPQPAGSLEAYQIAPLLEQTDYCAILRVTDDAGNAVLSPSIAFTTLDETPPDPAMLVLGTVTSTSIQFGWTAPGDDGMMGQAAEYDLRFQAGTCTLSAQTYEMGTQLPLDPPAAGGTPEVLTIVNVSSGSYCFILITFDESGNGSASNVLNVMVPDTTPPAAPVLTGSARVNDVDVRWTAVGDDGTTGTAASYELRFQQGTCTLTSANFSSTGTVASMVPAPAVAGTMQTAQVMGLNPDTDTCIMLKVSDEAGNSAFSNLLTVRTKMTPGQQITAVRAAIGALMGAGTPKDLFPPMLIEGALVSYVKPALGMSPVDGAGFFIQNDPMGPALLILVDPDTIASNLAPGDVVDLTVTQGAWMSCTLASCTKDNSIYVVTAATGMRTASGVALPPLQNISMDARFMMAIDPATWDLDAELIGVRGVLNGGFAAADPGFSRMNLRTAGTGATSALSLRMPNAVWTTLGVGDGCDVSINGTPMWRFNNSPQAHAWRPTDVTVNACPALNVTVTPANSAANVAAGATPITLAFNLPVAPATLTVQPRPGPCTGNVQVSSDNFATCLGFPGMVAMSNFGLTATLTPGPGFSYGTTYAIRLAGAVGTGSGNTLVTQRTSTFSTQLPPAPATGPAVVISAVYSAGGTTGATWNADYVELFNRSSNVVALGAYSINYSAGNATSNFTSRYDLPTTAMLQPGQYYLVKLGTTSATVGGNITGDTQSTGINMGGASGRVILGTNRGTNLSGVCPAASSVVDYVFWGAVLTDASCATYQTLPSINGNTTSLQRNGAGCAFSGTLASDWTTASPAPAPRMSSSPAFICPVQHFTANESGRTTEIDSCRITQPVSIMAAPGTSLSVFAQVNELGFTEAPGMNGSVRAEFGYGPASVNPSSQSGYTFFPATYNGAGTPPVGFDEYVASFTTPAAGEYGYFFRFSTDGLDWTYCDVDGAGSAANLFYDVTKIPVMSIQ